MGGAFSIRRCDSSDAATLASLGARLFSDSYGPTHPEPELGRYLARSFSVDSVRDAMSADDVSMLMVEDSTGHPIAYAYLRPSPEPPNEVIGSRPFEIVRFYVDASRQGKGVGAALMEACFRDAKERGADVVWLQVWTQAPWAIGFYHRMGFSVAGSTVFYFGERIDDDHVMSRSL